MIFFSNPIVMPFELHKFMTDSKRSCTIWHSESKRIIVSSLSLQRQQNLVKLFLFWIKINLWLKCNYRFFLRTIGRYFFSLISWLFLIFQMWPIYCFMKFRDLKITCILIQIWKIMQIIFEIHCKNISANITWNSCGL
jgi:hypothetical protein